MRNDNADKAVDAARARNNCSISKQVIYSINLRIDVVHSPNDDDEYYAKIIDGDTGKTLHTTSLYVSKLAAWKRAMGWIDDQKRI